MRETKKLTRAKAHNPPPITGLRLLLIAAFFFKFIVLSPQFVSADEIYKWVDKDGTIRYSTKKLDEDQAPADLPDISREDLDKKIDNLRLTTPNTCQKHGGIDCSQGSDKDGSVICLDGFRDALPRYNAHCLQTNLEGDFQVLFWSKREPYRFAKSGKIKRLRDRPKSIRLVLRNLNRTKAENMTVSVTFPPRRKFILKGPANIAPYGVANYDLELLDTKMEISEYTLNALEVNADCSNCRVIKIEGL